MKVFSESAKKTQTWQLAFYVEIDKEGLINKLALKKLIPS
jgi:hypothetical protein